MRQNIKLEYSTSDAISPSTEKNANIIYLYSHWDGDMGMSPLKLKLKNALAKKLRWNDESYLARIIFDEVIGKNQGTETGYGLAPYAVDQEFPTIVVDLEKQRVDGVSFEDFINDNY